MIWRSEPGLPSPHRKWPLVRSGPTDVPLASAPWQPAQVPPDASPSKMRSPRESCFLVAPGGGVSAAISRPAAGLIPSGGSGLPELPAVAVAGAGAGERLATAVLP